MDLNLFMMCEQLNASACSDLPSGCHIRKCRKSELETWKAMPFDDAADAKRHRDFMTEYYERVYAPDGDLFFERCLFVCDETDKPVATCFEWRAYGKIMTIHWWKVLRAYEGQGIGRALLSVVMKGINPDDYPVFLHTQPGSYRAIKLYSDFGFALLEDENIGPRHNDLAKSLPYLKKYMSPQAYANLAFTRAPDDFLQAVSSSEINQF